MRLIEAFRFGTDRRIAFTGAGGKTTAMFRLAQEARQNGFEQVFIAATTHLGVAQAAWGDTHTILQTVEDLVGWQEGAGVHVFTGPIGEDDRTAGLPLDVIDALEVIASRGSAPLLVEADGSRRKPLKAPAAHEPVIPPWVDEVVLVAGMQGVGKPLADGNVHRVDRFAALSGLRKGEPVTVQALAKVLLDAEGGRKGIPQSSRRTVLLNQCDTDAIMGQANQLAGWLIPQFGQVILAQLENVGEQEVTAVRRRAAGVVLAAGGSGRMGQPKQLLDWFGRSFVRAVSETALAAGLWPVLVVTGAAHEQVREAISGLPVQVVENPLWKAGQSTSVQAAVNAFRQMQTEAPLAAVFLLVDQPQIPVPLVQALLANHASTLSPIVAPLVDDRRGNPVLFSQETFDALLATKGDAGGRQVFSRFRVEYFPWLDAGAGMDVDTPEDYAALLAAYQD